MSKSSSTEQGKLLEFPNVVLHELPGGKQAFVLGTGMKVWEIELMARALDGGALEVADFQEINLGLVEEALRYARCFPQEVEAMIERHQAFDLEEVRKTLPGVTVFRVPVDTEPL